MEKVEFTAYMRSMTPIQTATPPPGQDTPWRGIVAQQEGTIVSEAIEQYACKVHENKRNGGLAYTRWTEMKMSIEKDKPLTISWVILNASHGSPELVHAWISSFESQVRSQPLAKPLPGPAQVRVADQANLAGIATVIFGNLASFAVGRLQSLLTNRDGPVAFKTVTIEKPFKVNLHEHIDLSASCSGLTGRANYLVDVVLVRTA